MTGFKIPPSRLPDHKFAGILMMPVLLCGHICGHIALKSGNWNMAMLVESPCVVISLLNFYGNSGFVVGPDGVAKHEFIALLPIPRHKGSAWGPCSGGWMSPKVTNSIAGGNATGTQQ